MIPPKQKVQLRKAPRQKAPDLDALDGFFAALSDEQVVKAMAPVLTGESPDPSLDDLFPPDAAPPPRPPTRWRGCVACGSKAGLRAHPEHDVCMACATDPQASRRRLEIERAAVINQQRDAAREAQAAYDALSDAERARWEAFAMLRARDDMDDALSDAERHLLANTKAAYAAPEHPRITPALRRVWHTTECLHWANEANHGRQRQINTQLAQLGLCLEALGRKDEADALYPPRKDTP